MKLYQIELPMLMEDDSEKDGRAEIVMDYIISWTLRRADILCSTEKPILYKYCRQILATLLGLKLEDDMVFEMVKVWKQDQNIDLWVELTVRQGNTSQRHAILIEDKFYDKLRDHQLETYKEIFDNHYAKQNEEWQKHYLLISCVERGEKFDRLYGIAPTLGFKTFSFYEIFGKDHEECESDIFNEFWIRW